jgi:two-component system response regulator NreC
MRIPEETVTILIVEDHTVVREGLRALIESHEGFKVVGECSDGREAIEKADALMPDIVIMDLFLENLNGIEAMKEIRKKTGKSRILVLSMYDNEDYVVSSVRAGARGYLLKGSGISEVVRAIEQIMSGKTYFSPAVADRLSESTVADLRNRELPMERLEKLTAREKQVLRLIARGKTSAQIGKILSVSLKTVETHRTNLMGKLDIHNIAGLVRFAVSAGLIPPT